MNTYHGYGRYDSELKRPSEIIKKANKLIAIPNYSPNLEINLHDRDIVLAEHFLSCDEDQDFTLDSISENLQAMALDLIEASYRIKCWLNEQGAKNFVDRKPCPICQRPYPKRTKK